MQIICFFEGGILNKKHSSAYHPEGDGKSERGIWAVKQILRCLIAEHNLETTDWPALLSRISYTIISVTSVSTGFLPYKIMFGVDPIPTSGAELQLQIQDKYGSVLEWVEDLQRMETLVNDQVTRTLHKPEQG